MLADTGFPASRTAISSAANIARNTDARLIISISPPAFASKPSAKRAAHLLALDPCCEVDHKHSDNKEGRRAASDHRASGWIHRIFSGFVRLMSGSRQHLYRWFCIIISLKLLVTWQRWQSAPNSPWWASSRRWQSTHCVETFAGSPARAWQAEQIKPLWRPVRVNFVAVS